MASGYEQGLVLEAVSSLELFRGCKKADLTLVAQSVSGRINVDAGSTLCREGDAAEHWWVVMGGTGDVSVDGVEVGTVGVNEPVGELALFDDQPRSATVTAAERLDVLVFDKGPFLDAIQAAPPLAVSLLRAAATRLRNTNALV